MRPTRRQRHLRCLRNVDCYTVMAVIGVVLFVLFANSLAATAENDIVTSAKAKSTTRRDRHQEPTITSVGINTRTVSEQGLEHVRDVVRYMWPHLVHLPTLHARSADLAYLLGSAILPDLPREKTEAYVRKLAAETEDVPALMALTAVVSLADNTAALHQALQAALRNRIVVPSESNASFVSTLAKLAAGEAQGWPARADEALLERHARDTGTAAMNGIPPSLATDVDLHEQVLLAWLLGGKQNEHLLAAYRSGVQALVHQRVRTQEATNMTIVSTADVLSDQPHVIPAPARYPCEVVPLLAAGVRLGAHPRRPTVDADALRGGGLTEQAVLDVAESLAASCVTQSWHNTTSGVSYLDPLSHRVFTTALDQPGAGTASLSCHNAVLRMRMYYELYLTTEDALYAVWALRAFSASVDSPCRPSPEAFRMNTGSAITAAIDELRYFSYLMHALYCKTHLPVRQEKALCALHQRTVRWSGAYTVVVPHS